MKTTRKPSVFYVLRERSGKFGILGKTVCFLLLFNENTQAKHYINSCTISFKAIQPNAQNKD